MKNENEATFTRVDLDHLIQSNIEEVKGTRQTITAHQDDEYSYSAIIVPQRVDNRMPLIEVVIKGVSYLFESKFQFKPGVEHLVNLTITENPEQVKIDIGGEIKGWND